VERGLPLPEKWHHYSQHAYETFPLPTDYVSSADVLWFRDEVLHRYFEGERYLSMVRKKFGEEIVVHILRMTSIRLKRKLLEGYKPPVDLVYAGANG
jgi:hypothetical protein